MAFLLFSLLPFVLCAQKPKKPPIEEVDNKLEFEHLSTQEGLSQSIVTAISQDKRGFIWIGTEDGLNRFDGIRINVYRNEFSQPNTISDNWIRGMVLDSDGDLWIATHKGLSKYNDHSDNFTQFHHNPQDPSSLASDFIISICHYKGDIWAGTGDEGISRYNKKTGRFRHYRFNPEKRNTLPSNEIKVLYVDKSDNLWIGTGNGLCRYNERTDEFVLYRGDVNAQFTLSDNEIRAIYEDSRNLLWIGTGSAGVSRFNENRTGVVNYSANFEVPEMMRKSGINTIFEDDVHTLWIGTTQGLLKRDPGEWRFRIAKNSLSLPKSLSNNDVSAIFEDRSNMLWVGTKGGGVNIYDVHRKRFKSFKHDYKNPKSLAKDVVRAIYEDKDGFLWIGLREGGLDRFEKDTETFTHYASDLKKQDALWGETVSAIYEDRFGAIWIGTWGQGLNRFDKHSGKFDHFQPGSAPGSISDSRIQGFLEDQEGGLWIATDGGLNYFDRAQSMFRAYNHNPEDPNSLSNNAIQGQAFFEDDEGYIWIGTYSGGINRFDRKTGKFTHYVNNPQTRVPLPLPKDGIISFYGQHDVIWIGTDGHGLYSFNKYSFQVKKYSTADGLSSDVIYAILPDDHGNLWLSTKNGICKFNTEKESFKTYYDYHGLQSNVFYWGAAFRSKLTGEMFFGGISGFTYFHPKEIEDNRFVPPIYINEFKINNDPVPLGKLPDGRILLTQHIADTRRIVLGYTDRFFSFGFAALNFSHPERNMYRYKMEPFDEDWRHTDAQNPYAPYTNLPPGTYTFKVMGANNDGLWNQEPAEIEVVMKPPWWGTWAFRIFAVLLIGGGTYMYYLNRLRRLQRQKRELVEQVKLRTAEIMLKNQELEKQKLSIIKQNEKIQSSINYAQRIQKGMLPVKAEMDTHFKDHFVLFKPKDVVSGDFYWMSSKGHRNFLAVVDCTGHGVPGAFMSMIGIDLLKETVNMRGIIDPSQVLHEMHQGVRNALHQTENRTRDGMDMAFCSLERLSSGHLRLEYAGAHNPLVYIQNGNLEILKASKLAIGGLDEDNASRVYEKHEMMIDRPTWVYLYSDGYQDQFGGEDGRKLMSKNFKRFLLQIHQKPMEEQKQLLEEHLEAWKQGREQTDDILVIGLRLDKEAASSPLTQMGTPEFLLHK